MISVDTNILLAGTVPNTPAYEFLTKLSASENAAISEFALIEFYVVLRNPKVTNPPLAPEQAVAVCQHYRLHPHWKLLGFPPDSVRHHEKVWRKVQEADFARRRIYDVRMGISLIEQGVTEFATVNVKDFEGLGFRKVWNPLVPS